MQMCFDSSNSICSTDAKYDFFLAKIVLNDETGMIYLSIFFRDPSPLRLNAQGAGTVLWKAKVIYSPGTCQEKFQHGN